MKANDSQQQPRALEREEEGKEWNAHKKLHLKCVYDGITTEKKIEREKQNEMEINK